MDTLAFLGAFALPPRLLEIELNLIDERAIPCVFLGYPYGQKAYKLLDIESRRILVSRDVVFHEGSFPFQDTLLTDPSHFPLVVDAVPDDVAPDSGVTHPGKTVTSPGLVDAVPGAPMQDSGATCFTDSGIHDAAMPHVYQRPLDASLEVNTSSSGAKVSGGDMSHEQGSTEPADGLRRSSRPHVRPRFLEDYDCNLVVKNCFNMLAFSDMPTVFHAHVASISDLKEPQTYEEASKDPGWVNAMNQD